MSLITLQNITKLYGHQDVLKQASLQLNAGERIGLIGPNGAGKTTLFRIILGQEHPDSGQVFLAKGLRLGHLPQDVTRFSGNTVLGLVMDTAAETRAVEQELEAVTEALQAASGRKMEDDELLELTRRQSHLFELFQHLGGYELEARAGKILVGLGFAEADFGRPVEEMSGGWIMRAALARLLLAEPDVLLLDEPTNHLDMDSLLWLEGYLKNCPSALLLISHDRTFLNNVVGRILEVEHGVVTAYAGNYNEYQQEKEKRQAAQAAAYANQQERIKQVERFIERNRIRASTARRAQSRIKMLEKMERIQPPLQAETAVFSLPPAPRAPHQLVSLTNVTKAYGDRVVYRDLDFTVHRGDRIAILGPNGTGKTTLLRLLAGVTDLQGGERRVSSGVVLSYFAQHQLEDLREDLTVLEELSQVAGPDLSVGGLRNILAAFLFQGDDVFKKVAVLSGGEKTRLILARMMLANPNLLLMDEPSNHLDIPGREMLESALKRYSGSLCLISHDRRFINAVANKTAMIWQGQVEIFPGNFDDFQNVWQDRLATGGQAAPGRLPSVDESSGRRSRAEMQAKKRAEAVQRQELYRLKAPLMEELARLEARLAELGKKLDEVTADLAAPENYQDQDRSRELNREFRRLRDENEKATAAWERAALRLEALEAAQASPDPA